MKKRIFSATMAILMIMSSCVGCAKMGNDLIAGQDCFADNSVSLSCNDVGYKARYMDFVFGSMKKCCEVNKDQNVMISPASVLFAMSMVESGAGGDTLDEMGSVMVPGSSGPEALGFAVDYYDTLSDNGDQCLEIANGLFINKDSKSKIYESYIDYVEYSFDADIDSFSFDKSGVDKINKWAEDKTEGMIPSIMDDLDPNEVSVLVNAIAFDANWAIPYRENDIFENMTFTNSQGVEEKVTMLNGNQGVYYETDKAMGFVKNYKKGFAFVAILPKDKSISANEFLATFDGNDYREFMSSGENALVKTHIPEFSFDYTNDAFDSVLKDLGMNRVFSDQADLSNMSNSDLLISRVMHKTHIELDRTGTRAAAVTSASSMTSGGSIVMKEVSIFLDRPFVFMIIENETETPIFIGTVNSVNQAG